MFVLFVHKQDYESPHEGSALPKSYIRLLCLCVSPSNLRSPKAEHNESNVAIALDQLYNVTDWRMPRHSFSRAEGCMSVYGTARTLFVSRLAPGSNATSNGHRT